jgi:hypothetical protein
MSEQVQSQRKKKATRPSKHGNTFKLSCPFFTANCHVMSVNDLFMSDKYVWLHFLNISSHDKAICCSDGQMGGGRVGGEMAIHFKLKNDCVCVCVRACVCRCAYMYCCMHRCVPVSASANIIISVRVGVRAYQSCVSVYVRITMCAHQCACSCVSVCVSFSCVSVCV